MRFHYFSTTLEALACSILLFFEHKKTTGSTVVLSAPIAFPLNHKINSRLSPASGICFSGESHTISAALHFTRPSAFSIIASSHEPGLKNRHEHRRHQPFDGNHNGFSSSHGATIVLQVKMFFYLRLNVLGKSIETGGVKAKKNRLSAVFFN